MNGLAPDHVCACRLCGGFPTGKPIGRGHFAVRFGQGHHRLSVYQRFDPWQEWIKVLACLEVYIGADSTGWAIVQSLPLHRCEKCSTFLFCLTRITGTFRVEGPTRVYSSFLSDRLMQE